MRKILILSLVFALVACGKKISFKDVQGLWLGDKIENIKGEWEELGGYISFALTPFEKYVKEGRRVALVFYGGEKSFSAPYELNGNTLTIYYPTEQQNEKLFKVVIKDIEPKKYIEGDVFFEDMEKPKKIRFVYSESAIDE